MCNAIHIVYTGRKSCTGQISQLLSRFTRVFFYYYFGSRVYLRLALFKTTRLIANVKQVFFRTG